MAVTRVPSTEGFCSFVEHFLLPNKPCIFKKEHTSTWKCRKLWERNGKPDFVYLRKEFGDAQVPVADCNSVQFQAHCKDTWKLDDYLTYWEEDILTPYPRDHAHSSNQTHNRTLLYLKDWHFSSAYTVLEGFKSDWLNEYCDQQCDGRDDYRFVYMGPKGTWTPFHADVFRSYSWSTNVCGQKEWLLYPPGEEEHLRDAQGNLPLDLTSPDILDTSRYPNAHKAKGPLTVIQHPGETIFVPSGWFHQVCNLDDTISVNHNWINGFGIQYMWRHLKAELQMVEKEIADCHGMEGWIEQCQLILKCNAGMNFAEFFRFLSSVTTPRLKQLEQIIGTGKLGDIQELPDSLIQLVIQQEQSIVTSYSIDPPTTTSILLKTAICKEQLDTTATQNTESSSILLEELLRCVPSDVRTLLSNKWSRWSDSVKLLIVIRVYEILQSCDIMEQCGSVSEGSEVSDSRMKCALYEMLR